MTQSDKNNTVITQGFIDKLIDKIGKILKEQHALIERDDEQEESIELLLEKVSLIEKNIEELIKSLAKGSYPLKLAKSIQVTESLSPVQIVPVELTKSQLIEIYNEIPTVLSSYVIPVTLTANSYRNLNSAEIILETTVKGNYWAITTLEDKQHKYWLVPNSNLKLNIHKLKTINSLFRLTGNYESSTSEYILQEPAILTLLPNNKQWKLLQPGVLFFSENLKPASSQLKVSQSETNKPTPKIDEQTLFTLTVLETTVEKLNNKLNYLEIQSNNFHKNYQKEREEWLAEKQSLNKQLQQTVDSQSQLFNLINQDDLTKYLNSKSQDEKILSTLSSLQTIVEKLNNKINHLENQANVFHENYQKEKPEWFAEKKVLKEKLQQTVDSQSQFFNLLDKDDLAKNLNFNDNIQQNLSEADVDIVENLKSFFQKIADFKVESQERVENNQNLQNQNEKIDLKNKISQFRQVYTKDKKLLLNRIIAKVTITIETLEKITFKNPDQIILENTPQGKYWVVDFLDIYFLIPSEISQITEVKETSLTVANILFDRSGYYAGYSNCDLIKPAIVTKHFTNQWKLEEKGKFNFS